MDRNSHTNLSQQQDLQMAQRLSPLQVRYVKLLEMNTAELEAAVERELTDNPALEATDTDDVPHYRLNIRNRDTDNTSQLQPTIADTTESLYDSLLAQLEMRHLPADILQAARYIAGSLDANGYLTRPLPSLINDMAFNLGIETDNHVMQQALEVVRSLDPAGVGAHDLRDSLLIQLNRREPSPAVADAIDIVSQCFDALAMKHYHRIMSALKMTQQRLNAAQAIILSLNPKPGSAVGNSNTDTSSQIIPDFNIEVSDGKINVSLAGNIPELTIDQSFTDALKTLEADTASGAIRRGNEFIVTRYNDARDFIAIIRQRSATLLSVMGAIASLQREYFLSGGDDRLLRPLILKDVAQLTGYDISTVSRSTGGKYAATDWGIIPLRHFFSERLTDDVSAREIQASIKALVDDEDKHHPLSDDSLCENLERQGYKLSRRTVAKYRSKMGIPVARLRKTM